jgi:hypothetical protein
MWRFPIPPGTAVVTTTYVTRDRLPILAVSRDLGEEGEEDWQFHCGNGDYDAARLQLVGIDQLVAADPTLVEVAVLAVGQTATRATVTGPWAFSFEH